MHKFTKVAYFLLIFSLLAVTVGSTKFALGLFVLCMFMIIIRVFTNRSEICNELGVHKESTKNIPEVQEESINEIQQDETQNNIIKEA